MFPLRDKIKYTLIHKIRLKEKDLISIKLMQDIQCHKACYSNVKQFHTSEEHYRLNKATCWNTHEYFARKKSHFDLS